MPHGLGTFVSNNRRFVPLAVTILMFLLAYGFGASHYEGMRDPQVFFNLFRTYPFLLISAVGMTFVILTGGIDLSVSGVVALTTVVAASLLRAGWNAWAVIALLLVMGTAIGALQGAFITYLKVQPFIATLAGMWVTQGLCFFISDDAIAIDSRVFRILGQTKILIPGLADPVKKTGDFISFLVVVALAVVAVAIFVAHYTRFGRTVYAIGGSERSAELMGLPVKTTKVLVYTLNGFCSGLAGITLSIYVMSGHGLYAQGFELDVISSVVMGGTPLSGGTGYVFGTLLGVLVNVAIQTIIQFNGQLSSWWTKIVIGSLTLMFIGVQSYMLMRKARRSAALDEGEKKARADQRLRLWLGIAATVLVVLVPAALFLSSLGRSSAPGAEAVTEVARRQCQDPPYRHQTDAAALLQGGAAVIYERNGGPGCVDELYAIYRDGRVVGNAGSSKIEKRLTPAEVTSVVSGINDLGWFTDEMYSTWHTRCAECYGYYITVSHEGRTKTVKGVDGGTDAPSRYWDAASLIIGLVGKEKDR